MVRCRARKYCSMVVESRCRGTSTATGLGPRYGCATAECNGRRCAPAAAAHAVAAPAVVLSGFSGAPCSTGRHSCLTAQNPAAPRSSGNSQTESPRNARPPLRRRSSARLTQVITNVTTDMECYKQEIFGPVLVCQPRPWRAGALSHAHTHSREPESDPRITQLPTLSIHARRPH